MKKVDTASRNKQLLEQALIRSEEIARRHELFRKKAAAIIAKIDALLNKSKSATRL